MTRKRNPIPTMTDVARLAGVSQTTVSLVLNNKNLQSIPDVTKERIYNAIESLGYRPNKLASALNGKDSDMIGLITDELVTTGFAGSIVKGAQDVAWDNHKVLMLVNIDDRDGMTEEAVDMMIGYRVEAILFATMYHHEIVLPSNLKNTPVMLVNCYDMHNSAPSVVPDEFQGAYDATEYLIKNGHKNITFISNQKLIPATSLREDGFKAAFDTHSLPLGNHSIVRVDISGQHVRDKALELLSLDERPTAIFCYNDRCAMGVYSAAAALGLCIPEDLSVVGYDNQEVITEFLIPTLTTMALPHYEMGEFAINYIHNNQFPYEKIKEKIRPKLVVRNSVRKINQ